MNKAKVWDVVPATNFIQDMVAKMNYDLIGLTIRRTKIEVVSEANQEVSFEPHKFGWHWHNDKICDNCNVLGVF